MKGNDKKTCINPGVCGCPLGKKYFYFNLTSQGAAVSFTRAWHKGVYISNSSQSHLLQPCFFTPLWPYQEVRNMILFFKGNMNCFSKDWKDRASICQMYPIPAEGWLLCNRLERNSWVITVWVFMSPGMGKLSRLWEGFQWCLSA